MSGAFSIVVLGSEHDRTRFTCGVAALDRYFREQVGEDVKRRATACYIAADSGTGQVAGYYTLAAAGVPLVELPASLVKRLPRYPLVPVARLGRLAVDLAYRGRKLGGALVWDAVTRAMRSEGAVSAIVVDAKDESAEAIYRHLGFVMLEGEGRRLVLPLTGLKTRPKS